MTQLSVNVNKIATLRNSRGGNIPNLDLVVNSIMNFGVDGITIHPRPDERHIKKKDVLSISKIIRDKVEFNIEGFPSDQFIDMVLRVKPNQVTLVPDSPNVLTSLEGWNILKNKELLKRVVKIFKDHKIRTSIFIDPDLSMVQGAASINSDRIELFTGIYADNPHTISSYIDCSSYANKIGLGVNAGHDLNLENLPFFIKEIPFLNEVSIGHALISESLFLGLEDTINRYKKILI